MRGTGECDLRLGKSASAPVELNHSWHGDGDTALGREILRCHDAIVIKIHCNGVSRFVKSLDSCFRGYRSMTPNGIGASAFRQHRKLASGTSETHVSSGPHDSDERERRDYRCDHNRYEQLQRAESLFAVALVFLHRCSRLTSRQYRRITLSKLDAIKRSQ